MQEVSTRNYRSLELGTPEGMNVTIWISVWFQKRDRQDSQKMILFMQWFKHCYLFRLRVTSAQCIIDIEKHPDAAILMIYDDADYFQGYGQIKEIFRAVTKDDILEPFISDQDFRLTHVNEAGEDDITVC